MGYPMTWRRVVNRNNIAGEYHTLPGLGPDGAMVDRENAARNLIAGDMRRLEQDSRDPIHLRECARHVGITEAQVKAVLDVFFGDVRAAQLPVDEWRELRRQMDAAIHGTIVTSA